MSATTGPGEHAAPDAAARSFSGFYQHHFLPEHLHRGNVALHLFGTLAGLAWIAGGVLAWSPLWMLLFPAVHAVPGLIGHRLWERNAAVGDARVFRTDFPGLWFLAANHVMTWEVLSGARRLRAGRWVAP